MAPVPRWTNLLRRTARVIGSALRPSTRTRPTPGPTRAAPRPTRRGPAAATTTPGAAGQYPGDFAGVVAAVYAPRPDGAPDPGEVVWTWVPYEEDHSRGKDRPVLLVGRDGPWLLALQLTSKDHDRDAAQEARWGRLWMDIGSGPWDRQGRPSEVRVNRVVRVDPRSVRREGAVLPRRTFDGVVAAMRRSGH
ncbi:type II toxin-antitoxin system PemK/MazF family toxin [Isoptericola jiangsuensis]|uniref:type II toxin-antitoxin system PemK/MazF family toxin n=1 Tax=Isoptericola jiangsuensis TaxID=548579 RepID=UPI003AAACA09